MTTSKILEDLIDSAIGTKTHFDVWWTLVSDARRLLINSMNQHPRFFLASQDAHYTACFVYFAHFFDKRKDSSSLPNYLTNLKNEITPDSYFMIKSQFDELETRAKPLLSIRHKTIAHVDINLNKYDIFSPLEITWNDVRAIIYDTVKFVEYLAVNSNYGSTGIPRDGLMNESTMKLINEI